jgi:hypothetical protein
MSLFLLVEPLIGVSTETTQKERRRIIFTEDRKEHKDNSFNVKANAVEPPLHKRSAGSASDQEIGADCTAGYDRTDL